MIDLNKKYRTESGLPVELYKKHDCGLFPIIGAYFEHNAWRPSCWGENDNKHHTAYNLVEVPNFKPSFILERYTKLFEYFGLPLSIPDGIQWLATDEDGTLYGYFTEPYCVNLGSLPDQGYWDDDEEGVKIAKIQIIGDWKQSKINVNFNK